MLRNVLLGLCLVLLGILLGWNTYQQRLLSRMESQKFIPLSHPDIAIRDTLDDGGYSEQYGLHHRPYCNFWSDAHSHTYSAEVPQQVRNKWLLDMRRAKYEINIVNGVVFCKTEEDLQLVVDSLPNHAPVWWASIYDPDIGKLREYKERYGIKGVKIYYATLVYAEARGDTMEFPVGSGKMVPVSIDMAIAPEWMEFYRVCEELDLPISCHSNVRLGPAYYNFGGDGRKIYSKLTYDNFYIISHVEKILTAFPKLRYVLCHQGFMGPPQLDKYFAKYPNLFVDTSAGMILHDGDYLTDAEREIYRSLLIKWPDRFLFGTDSGVLWIAPEGQTEEWGLRRMVYQLIYPTKNFIMALQLPQDVLSKVAHRNFERVFNMPQSSTEDWPD
ncbi:amidohydrolase family protein [Gemmatimonadota bacterium]